jgi:SOS response regulatory protein OraA/RecX
VAVSPDPIEIALRALGRRDLSCVALDVRLEAAGIEPEARRRTLQRLLEAGLLDDNRLAESRIAALAARGLGNTAIAAKLAAEGIGREPCEAALAGIEPEEARARRLLAEVGETEPRRLASLLTRRGFGEEAIEAAMTMVDGPLQAELG